MADLFSIYDRGIDALSQLEEVRENTIVDSARPGEPKTIAGRVRVHSARLEEINSIWRSVVQPQPPHEVENYEADIRPYRKAIERLEFIAENKLIDLCLAGIIIGIGYTESNRPFLVPIQPSEWAFLDLEYQKSSANTAKTNYARIRFIKDSALSDEEVDLLASIFKSLRKKPASSTSKSEKQIKNYHFHGDRIMGDSYTIGQAAVVGDFATVKGNKFNNKIGSNNLELDLEELALQLSKLRSEMRKVACDPEHDESLGAIAAAEKSANKQNKDLTIANLKKAGKWALGVAEKTGINLAAKLIEYAITS